MGNGCRVWLCVVLCIVQAGCLVASGVTTTSSAPSAVRDPREFCAAEEFRPQCSAEQEVVMVTNARYGRMQLGECVKTDYGYVGCSIDVIEQLDDVCSGRRNCSVRIPDTKLELVNVCPKEFKAYLNVSFDCIRVEKSVCDSCSPMSKTSVAKVTQLRGFIGSIVTLESASGVCGSAQCPWVIEAQSGQTINLTLFDFSNKQAMSSSVSPGQCIRLAVVKEAAHLKESPICYRQTRIQSVYSSVSHSIQIHIVSREVLKTKGQFLIQYEVIGCPDRHPPENAWLKRSGDRVTVGCNDPALGLRWESRCVDSKWEGEIGVCPGSTFQPTSAPSILTLPLGVLVAIVLGIALVIGVLIVTVGVVCLKRQQNELLARAGNVLYVPAGQCYELREDYPSGGHSSMTAGRKVTSASEHDVGGGVGGGGGGGSKERHLVAGRRNVYAHTRMECRPLPSLPEASNERGAAARGLHVDLGPSESCPYHLRMSTLGRTPQKSSKTGGWNGKRKVEGKGGGGGAQAQTHATHIPLASCSAFGGSAGVAAAPSSSSSSSAGAFPCSSSHLVSAVPQHYTVLDPIEVQHQQQLTGTMPRQKPAAASLAHSLGGATDAGPSSPGGATNAAAAGTNAAPPKPPLLPSTTVCLGVASARGGDDGIEKSSCREITLRPTRQNSARAKTNDNDTPNSGNSSWP